MRTDTASPAPGAKEAVSEAWRALPGIAPDGARGRAAVLRHPASATPALGLDGTLAGIVPDPAAAVPLPDAVRATAHRAATCGRVGPPTGGPPRDMSRERGLPGAGPTARAQVPGLYGADRRDPVTARARIPGAAPAPAEAHAEIRARPADRAVGPGVRWADEEGALTAPHEPPAEPVVRLGPRAVTACVVEPRVRDVDEGTAPAAFLEERYIGGPVGYAGDDHAGVPGADAPRERRRRTGRSSVRLRGAAWRAGERRRADAVPPAAVLDGPERRSARRAGRTASPAASWRPRAAGRAVTGRSGGAADRLRQPCVGAEEGVVGVRGRDQGHVVVPAGEGAALEVEQSEPRHQ